MRHNGTVESRREFHFAGILLIGASVVAGLVLSLLVVSHEQTARAQAQPAATGDAGPAPVALFTTPTPPVVQVAVPQAAASATAAPVQTTAPVTAAAQTTGTSSEAVAPKTVAAAAGAPAAQQRSGGDAVAGATVFGNLCGACHPGGNAGLGPSVKGLPAAVIAETVKSGKGMMPAFAPPNLTDQQLLDIIAFLENGG